MPLLRKIINKIFGNLDSIPNGVEELLSPLEKAIVAFINSDLCKILYYIPTAIVRSIYTAINWYYDNFMDNPAILDSDAKKVLFIYIIPGVVITGLVILFSMFEGYGWYLLSISPFLYIFFPFFILLVIAKTPNWISQIPVKRITRKEDKLICWPRPSVEVAIEEVIRKNVVSRTLLEYALNRTRGYKKTLSNLRVPDKDGNINEVESVLINKNGVQVWGIRCYHEYCYYGKREDEIWHKNYIGNPYRMAKTKFHREDITYNTTKLVNPLIQNRKNVNAIQTQLKLNGFDNIHMFSGVVLTSIDTSGSDIECLPDEAICTANEIPEVSSRWGKMRKAKKLSREEIDKIAQALSRFADNTETANETICESVKRRIEYDKEISKTLGLLT